MRLDSSKYTGYHDPPKGGPIEVILNAVLVIIVATLGFMIANCTEVMF